MFYIFVNVTTIYLFYSSVTGSLELLQRQPYRGITII